MKLRRWGDWDGVRDGLTFWCPGCQGPHAVTTRGPGAWTFNGDLDAPVFSPSVLVQADYPDGRRICHSFVGMGGAPAGHIVFLSDCTHALAGQTVPLPDWPDA
ncbi:DUF6527 family protein [Deinococcus sp. 12RED42]|uniref:DUF6527 family protein n=1 Tax=Deinococcus sp. 12RED42 TaxID=2745872 RepID=UPI001E51F833